MVVVVVVDVDVYPANNLNEFIHRLVFFQNSDRFRTDGVKFIFFIRCQ